MGYPMAPVPMIPTSIRSVPREPIPSERLGPSRPGAVDHSKKNARTRLDGPSGRLESGPLVGEAEVWMQDLQEDSVGVDRP